MGTIVLVAVVEEAEGRGGVRWMPKLKSWIKEILLLTLKLIRQVFSRAIASGVGSPLHHQVLCSCIICDKMKNTRRVGAARPKNFSE